MIARGCERMPQVDRILVQNTLSPNRRATGNCTVGIVVNTYNQARFLAEALRSCLEQTVPPSEILVVDDGSHDNPKEVAESFPGIAFYHQNNAGQSSAKNAGLARLSSELVVFLDADDRLNPAAIEAGLECFANNPDAALVYGAFRFIDAAGRPASPVCHERLGAHPFLELLRRGNVIGMQGAVMYRTDRLRSIRGFDENLHLCEDYDAYLRLARVGQIAAHECCVAEYRIHGQNISRDPRAMYEAVCSVVQNRAADNLSPETAIAAKSGLKRIARQYAPRIFRNAAKHHLAKGWSWNTLGTMFYATRMAPLTVLGAVLRTFMEASVKRLPRSLGWHFGEALWVPKVGRIRFGDFGRTTPISVNSGFDRGKPIDRYFIEKSLQDRSTLIRGRVLEVGGRDYTKMFGNKIDSSDILDINQDNPVATIVGDLGVVNGLPEAKFDCIILTQTLQYIYNLDTAMENLYCALAPGGSLLITVPGISPINHHEMRYWYWAFTELSLKTLLSKRFGESNVELQSYGNVFAAVSFLTGLSLSEVETEKLDYKDKSYPITVFACAQKPNESS